MRRCGLGFAGISFTTCLSRHLQRLSGLPVTGAQEIDHVRMCNSNIYFSNIFRKFIIHKQARETGEGFKFKPIHLPNGSGEKSERHTVSPPRRAMAVVPVGSRRACLAGQTLRILGVGCEKHRISISGVITRESKMPSEHEHGLHWRRNSRKTAEKYASDASFRQLIFFQNICP